MSWQSVENLSARAGEDALEPDDCAADIAVIRATAVAEVFGDGQKLTGALLEYREPIIGAELTTDSFAVSERTVSEGRTVAHERTVTEVYTCGSDDPEDRSADGCHVMVRLSPADPRASLKEPPRADEKRTRSGPPELGERMPPTRFRSPVVALEQVGPIRTVAGSEIPPADRPMVTSAVSNLVVDDFVQAEFHDPETGDTLKYNLFVPEGHDGSTACPLVLFMHDAGTSADDPLVTLKQGLGAVVFAGPDSQAKHPCLVLAPQYSAVVVNDASQATSALETTIHLIEKIAGEYGVDTNRMYTTGQSGGAMMSIAIDIRHPGLFAASLIVAGQWAPALVAPLAGQKLWIVVAEGDAKAFPGQNAITDVLERHGTVVARANWDGREEPSRLGAAAAQLAGAGAPINYSVLRSGTVVPEGQADDPPNNHINTWRIAYTIEPIRNWLFAQRRDQAV